MTVADSDGLYYFEGSPAAESGAIMSTQPLSSNDPTNIVSSLIHPWLKDCLLLHAACFTTVSAEIIDDRHGSDLPRRILQVRPGPDPSFVKIVHSDGLVSKYCALSHCWGPPEKRPFRTTAENMERVISGIPIDELPRTFREVIALVRAMEIDYLWIDSLCIIQDDQQD